MTDSERIAELEKKVRELESKNPQIIIMPAPIYYPQYNPTPIYYQPYYQPQIICGQIGGGTVGLGSIK